MKMREVDHSFGLDYRTPYRIDIHIRANSITFGQ